MYSEVKPEVSSLDPEAGPLNDEPSSTVAVLLLPIEEITDFVNASSLGNFPSAKAAPEARIVAAAKADATNFFMM